MPGETWSEGGSHLPRLFMARGHMSVRCMYLWFTTGRMNTWNAPCSARQQSLLIPWRSEDRCRRLKSRCRGRVAKMSCKPLAARLLQFACKRRRSTMEDSE